MPPLSTRSKTLTHGIKAMSVLSRDLVTQHDDNTLSEIFATLSKKSSRVQTSLTNTSRKLVTASNEEMEKIYKRIESLRKRKAEILREMALISDEQESRAKAQGVAEDRLREKEYDGMRLVTEQGKEGEERLAVHQDEREAENMTSGSAHVANEVKAVAATNQLECEPNEIVSALVQAACGVEKMTPAKEQVEHTAKERCEEEMPETSSTVEKALATVDGGGSGEIAGAQEDGGAEAVGGVEEVGNKEALVARAAEEHQKQTEGDQAVNLEEAGEENSVSERKRKTLSNREDLPDGGRAKKQRLEAPEPSSRPGSGNDGYGSEIAEELRNIRELLCRTFRNSMTEQTLLRETIARGLRNIRGISKSAAPTPEETSKYIGDDDGMQA